MAPSSDPRSEDSLNLQYISDSVDPQDINESGLRLLRQLSEDQRFADCEVDFEQLTDGITNTIIKATPKKSGQSKKDADREAALIRVYGNGTDYMIDREVELLAHDMLAKKGIAAPLLARFENGFMCNFIPGDPTNPEDFHNPDTYRQIAKTLGQWHATLPISVLIKNSSPDSAREPDKHAAPSQDGKQPRPVPNLWTNAERWIGLLPNDTGELQERNEQYKRELAWLSEMFGDIAGLNGQDYVFSHTDLLCANVIIEGTADDKMADRAVTFIDYEYAKPAPQAFDIANFFAEWAGPDGELSWMPSQSQRRDFIERYVKSFREQSSGNQSDVEKDVSQIYDQVDLFRGLPGFYWGIWGLIQASISDIDFDYPAYAERRLSEYWGWKAEHDGSRKRDGKEMTVREKAWARE